MLTGPGNKVRCIHADHHRLTLGEVYEVVEHVEVFTAMILSEEAAGQRWCPMAMSFYYNGSMITSANRDMPGGNIPACIASTCMYWRWAEAKQLRDIDLVTSDIIEEKPRTGYCGAAGKVIYGD